MKKINVLLAALTLAVTAITPMTSSAVTTLGGDTNTGTTEISKTYVSSYTVTIPDSVDDFSKDSTLPVEATNVFLNYNEKLVVSVASKNGWALKDKAHEANNEKISYTLNVGDTSVANDSTVLEVSYTEKNKSVDLTVSEMGTATYAGTYTDTLTFSVKTENITETPTSAS